MFKTASSKNASDLLEVRLVSGDVDSRYPVTWSATPNAHWITMSVLAGAVATERPVAEAIVTADSSGYPDANGPLISSIVVRSRSNAPRFASNAEDVDTENLSIDVQMIVKALAVLNHAHVVIITSRGDALTAPDGNWNVKVEAKSSMLIVVKAFDCEALPINFTEQQFQLQLDGPTGVKNVSLMHSGANQYEVELTGSVLDQTGPYKLTLSVGEIEAEGFTLSDSRYVLCYLAHSRLCGGCSPDVAPLRHPAGCSSVVISVDVVDTSVAQVVFGAVSAVILGGLVVAMIVVVYRNKERAKKVALSFLEFEFLIAADGLLELWDFIST